MQQRRGHGESLLETSGEIAAGQIDKLAEIEFGQCPFDAALFMSAPEIVCAGEKLQVFCHRKLAVK